MCKLESKRRHFSHSKAGNGHGRTGRTGRTIAAGPDGEWVVLWVAATLLQLSVAGVVS